MDPKHAQAIFLRLAAQIGETREEIRLSTGNRIHLKLLGEDVRSAQKKMLMLKPFLPNEV